jgi:tetratricopeptide (TPR) repeat protein
MIDFARDINFDPVKPENAGAQEAQAKTAYFFHRKGDALFVSSRFKEAAAAFQKSLEAYQTAADSQGAGLCLLRLGRSLEILGEYGKARQRYEESLKIFQDSHDPQGIARSKAHLGNVGWATGDYEEASNFLGEALSFYEVGEDKAGEAWVRDLMGNLRLAMREDEKAESYYLSAYRLAKELGDNLTLEAWNHYHLGTVALFRGQTVGAQERFSKALEYFVRVNDDLGQVATLVHLGELACLRKSLAEAEEHLQKAVQMVLPTDCKPLLADALTGVAQILKAEGEDRKAIFLLMVALSHRTCRQQTKDRMIDLVLHLESNYVRKEVEEGFKWAKTVSIEEMASSWLSAASAKDKGKTKKKKSK